MAARTSRIIDYPLSLSESKSARRHFVQIHQTKRLPYGGQSVIPEQRVDAVNRPNAAPVRRRHLPCFAQDSSSPVVLSRAIRARCNSKRASCNAVYFSAICVRALAASWTLAVPEFTLTSTASKSERAMSYSSSETSWAAFSCSTECCNLSVSCEI